MKMNDSLLSKLTMLDFKATDLQLYLDTHPDDTEAIMLYNKTIEEADAVRYEYESQFGPLCSFRSQSSSKYFSWVDNPWCWEKEFNFYIKGVDC
jgi:spore coat protein JB